MADEQVSTPATPATPDPTPAQLAAAAPDPTPVPATPASVATDSDKAVHPDLVAHSSSVIDYVNAELAKHKALLAVVTDVKKGINDLHTDLITAGEDVVAAEKRVHGYAAEHKLKIVLVVIALAAIGFAVVKFL
jgi:hypothetical protein